MIIVRTPYRLSFFGGSSDYEKWYSRHGGLCLASAIDKYSYVSLRRLPPYFPYRSRVVWSKVEMVESNLDIENPAIRGVLDYLKLSDQGLEVHYDSDIPARAGMGSSSAFVVGLLNAWWALTAEGKCPARTLAKTAIRVEREFCGDTVGIQDQVSCAYGNVNLIRIERDGDFSIQPVPPMRLAQLEEYLLLLFTGFTRHASEVAERQVAEMERHEAQMTKLMEMARDGFEILADPYRTLREFFSLLNEAWYVKRELSSAITDERIDDIHGKIIRAGATAAKLCGAGGGGFFLVAVEPERREDFLREFDGWVWFPVRFAHEGSRIIFQNDG